MTGRYDYGRAGLVGVGTPQANPTVEAELRLLLPPMAAMATARLTSRAADPETRLRDYLEGLGDTLAQFDTLRPHAFGFACTGSSYLLAPGTEPKLIDALQAQFGYPIITAAQAIDTQLRAIGARRIAIASPYPPALAQAAERYWSDQGYALVAVRRIETGDPDTRSIYTLGSADAADAARALAALPVDAVLLSGTGMPSLALLADPPASGPLLLSSNLCLTMALCRAIGLPEPDRAQWAPRLAEATASPQTPKAANA